MKIALVHFAEGFEEIEALTIVDVLRRADIPTKMVSVTEDLEVSGAHGVKVSTDILFEDVDYTESEIIILPGGMPGAKNLQEHHGLSEVIKKKAQNAEPLAAICAAPMVLGGLGLLEGVEATCYPGFENELTGANLKTDLSVKSNNIITGKGPGAAINFSLEIVKALKGEKLANDLAQAMIVTTWN